MCFALKTTAWCYPIKELDMQKMITVWKRGVVFAVKWGFSLPSPWFVTEGGVRGERYGRVGLFGLVGLELWPEWTALPWEELWPPVLIGPIAAFSKYKKALLQGVYYFYLACMTSIFLKNTLKYLRIYQHIWEYIYLWMQRILGTYMCLKFRTFKSRKFFIKKFVNN